MIIGIAGKINSGKDTVAAIIQYLIWKNKVEKGEKTNLHYTFKDFTNSKFGGNTLSNWEIKKFADKLKDIVCLLIGCTREQLEDREFKEKELGEEWTKHRIIRKGYPSYYVNSEEEALRELGKYTNCRFVEVKMTPRLLLQLIGTECGRNILHPNIWVNAIMGGYKKKYLNTPTFSEFSNTRLYSMPNWIITDTRFPNEFEAIKSRGGICIKIERIPKIRVQHSGQENDFTLVDYDPTNQKHVDLLKGERIVSKEHESETALDNAKFDYIIENNGTIEELLNKVKKILINEKII